MRNQDARSNMGRANSRRAVALWVLGLYAFMPTACVHTRPLAAEGEAAAAGNEVLNGEGRGGLSLRCQSGRSADEFAAFVVPPGGRTLEPERVCVRPSGRITFESLCQRDVTITIDGGEPFEQVSQSFILPAKGWKQMRLRPEAEGQSYVLTVNGCDEQAGGDRKPGESESMNGTLEVATSGGGGEKPEDKR